MSEWVPCHGTMHDGKGRNQGEGTLFPNIKRHPPWAQEKSWQPAYTVEKCSRVLIYSVLSLRFIICLSSLEATWAHAWVEGPGREGFSPKFILMGAKTQEK